VYGVDDIAPFLAKLDEHARRRVYMPTFTAAPITRFGAFWEPVHGEARVNLPGLPELLSVLWDMDIYPDVEMMDALRMSRGFKSREDALEQLRLRVYANPGTEKDALLQKAMDSMLTETDDGLVIESARPARLGIVNWKPA
jgi:hypothetical protein